MAIFDRILGKKETDKEPVEKGKKPKAVEVAKLRRSRGAKSESRPRGASGKKTEKVAKVAKKEENIAHQILVEPFITEKSTSLGEFNKYVFKVFQKAGKRQIKEAIQDYYGVRVVGVHTIKIHPKKRIHGRTVGYKKGYKKAIVTLVAGDTIGINESV
jgi:large subunit ribosomal protein L23